MAKLGAMLASGFLSFSLLLALVPLSPPTFSRDAMVEGAWFMAQRDARRLLGYREDIHSLRRPAVRLHPEGPFLNQDYPDQSLLGYYNSGTGLIEVAVTADPREDYGTLVHEDLHSIAARLVLTDVERMRLNWFAEVEWGAGSK